MFNWLSLFKSRWNLFKDLLFNIFMLPIVEYKQTNWKIIKMVYLYKLAVIKNNRLMIKLGLGVYKKVTNLISYICKETEM